MLARMRSRRLSIRYPEKDYESRIGWGGWEGGREIQCGLLRLWTLIWETACREGHSDGKTR